MKHYSYGVSCTYTPWDGFYGLGSGWHVHVRYFSQLKSTIEASACNLQCKCLVARGKCHHANFPSTLCFETTCSFIAKKPSFAISHTTLVRCNCAMLGLPQDVLALILGLLQAESHR